MVPDKFNMVNMGGIDIIAVQGQTVAGLYQKLVDSIALCRYQCLYNWKFDGITIPPTYVECRVSGIYVLINDNVKVDQNDVVHIYAPVIDANIIPISISENGQYSASGNVDGFSPVTVEVSSNNMLFLDREPTTQDGNVGDYCISTIPTEFDAVGIEILVAARDNNFSFNYYGTSSLRLTLKDSEDILVEVTDLPNASFYISNVTIGGGTNATNALTNQPTGNYYERSGLPGYFNVSATGIGNYTPVSLEFSRRSGSAYKDFVSTFNIILIKNNTKVGVLKSISGLTLSDWPDGQRVAFTDFTLPNTKELFYKTESGWVQII